MIIWQRCWSCARIGEYIQLTDFIWTIQPVFPKCYATFRYVLPLDNVPSTLPENQTTKSFGEFSCIYVYILGSCCDRNNKWCHHQRKDSRDVHENTWCEYHAWRISRIITDLQVQQLFAVEFQQYAVTAHVSSVFIPGNNTWHMDLHFNVTMNKCRNYRIFTSLLIQ